MIYGDIKDLEKYRKLSKNLHKAIDYILTGSYKNGSIGKNIVDGDVVYFNLIDKVMTKDENFFELHKKYIDIHIVIDGKERIAFSSTDRLKFKREYKLEDDSELFDGKIEEFVYLNPEKFVAFFPEEAHSALLKVEEKEEIKKVIFKILDDRE